MTYLKILLAGPSVQKIVAQELPLAVAYKFYKLVNRVNEEILFYRSKENEIAKKYDSVESPEYSKELNELLSLEVDWDMLPIQIKTDLDVNLSAADIDALIPFIEFVE